MPVTDGPALSADWVDVSGGGVTLGVDREVDRVRLGQRAVHATLRASMPSVIERVDVTNQRFLEFVNAGGYTDQRWWRPEDWAWLQRTTGSTTRGSGHAGRCLVVARHVRVDSAARARGPCM